VTLYFAYGSNMARRQMARRCPGAAVLGVVNLVGWRFIINTRGFATILPDTAGQVFGLLWRLAAGNDVALDRYEGVDRRCYVRDWLDLADHGRTLVYLATDSAHGKPRDGYLEEILRAAEAEGLPDAYMAELAKWKSSGF
jgi:hypothetical protein